MCFLFALVSVISWKHFPLLLPLSSYPKKDNTIFLQTFFSKREGGFSSLSTTVSKCTLAFLLFKKLFVGVASDKWGAARLWPGSMCTLFWVWNTSQTPQCSQNGKIVPTSLCYFIKKFEIVLQIVQFLVYFKNSQCKRAVAFISWQGTDYNEDNTLKSYFSLSQVHFPGATHFLDVSQPSCMY